MINKIMHIPFYTFFFCVSLNGSVLIKGDADAPEGQSFSFAIKQTAMSVFGNLYVGANESLITNQEFALSFLGQGSKQFEPLALELVVLNKQVDKPNPLYGAQINHLDLLRPLGGSDSPLVVTAANPAVVYLVEAKDKQINMVETAHLSDADGLPSSGIVSLESNVTTHVFAAVKPALGFFGDLGSGISMLVRGSIDTGIVFGEVDAATGSLVPHPRALPLDKTSAMLTFGGAPLSAMGSVVSLHWDEALKRLFIGLDVTSGSGSTDGALAVVVGRIEEGGGLELFSIAPDSAFASGTRTDIIGIRNGSGIVQQRVVVNNLTTLYTSTGLNYLIVAGGVADSNNVSQSVFALPLVNTGDSTGMLAKKNAQSVDVFSEGDVPRLTARTVSTVANSQADMTQSMDNAAQVGAGTLFAGTITNMIVRDDTVFVTVGNDKTGPDSSGVYSSQAIFNASGLIVGWTEWQRAAGTVDNVFNAQLNIFDGTITLLTGATDQTINTVLKTNWSDGNAQGLLPVTTFFNSIFNPSNGGIQSLQTFLPSTPGLADIAVMIAGGVGELVLVQTGLLENSIIIPTPADEFSVIKQYENGTITDLADAKIVAISGGTLNSIGAITATAVASNGKHGWIFAGGTNGLAVLSQPDGSGWDLSLNELGDRFDGLVSGMSFHPVGQYAFVKKLISDDSFLYVITNDRIDRINLLTTNFSNQNIDATTIATQENFLIPTDHGGILDAVISQSFALVATSAGLFRVGDGQDVRAIPSALSSDWEIVAIPETAGAPTQLLTVTTTGRNEDITRGIGGHVYVLSSNAGYNQSRVNRFAVRPLTSTEPMQTTTVTQFNDLFVKNIPSFFINFGNFNSIFATDGAFYFASRNKNSSQPPRVVLTPAYSAPQVAARNVGERSSTVKISLENGTEINGFQRSQASGSWMVAGDFGMQVLE